MGSAKGPVPPALRPEDVLRVPDGELVPRLYPVSHAVSTQPCGSAPGWAAASGAATVGTRTAAHRPVSPAAAMVTVRRIGVLMAFLSIGGGSAGPSLGPLGPRQLDARNGAERPRVGDRLDRTRPPVSRPPGRRRAGDVGRRPGAPGPPH